MQLISFPGEKVPYLISVALLALFYWFFRNRILSVIILASDYGVAAIVQIIKQLLKIPRPIGALETGYGFPSQHAASYVVFWGVLVITTKNKLLKALGTLMILMVGISRVYLGEHSVVDVVGGYVIGFTVLWLSWWSISRFGLQKS